MNNNIPILYYHSIADHNEESEWSFLSTPIKTFIRQIDYLYNNDYKTCDWDELYDHVNGVKKLPRKTIKFHFDDGFLDNWSVVFPLMKERNFKFSVLLTPEFIDQGKIARNFVEKTTVKNKTEWWGYLNLDEIKKMQQSGLVDFQSHGYTHTWYNDSDKVIDIYEGEKFYPHLIWNDNSNDKSMWLKSYNKPQIGMPIFEHKKSLELNSAFKVNEKHLVKLTNLYDSNKTKEENIKIYLDYIKGCNDFGAYETKEESENRLKKELKGSKDVLEEVIGKEINYLVFPGGGKSDRTIRLAKEAGYKLISQGNLPNSFGSKVFQVLRFSAVYSFNNDYDGFLNLLFLKLQLLRGENNIFVNKVFKIIKYVKNI